MKIHKEGYPTIIIGAIIVAAVIVLNIIFIVPSNPVIGWVIIAAIIGLFIFIISFFRIPTRSHATGEDVIVAP
ncbi:MAG TPA: phosphatidylserine decarboxylase family protein, partial [Flavisolibacter sp.]|nr:phosphatidylserine decarboxylase family protein [Flavisolibacter sp.]